jgi:hypothetical protein
LGAALGTERRIVSFAVLWSLVGWMDIYIGAFFAAEAFPLAWAFSAGSLVAGFPGVA